MEKRKKVARGKEGEEESINGATHGGYGTNSFLKHFCSEAEN